MVLSKLGQGQGQVHFQNVSLSFLVCVETTKIWISFSEKFCCICNLLDHTYLAWSNLRSRTPRIYRNDFL